MFKEHRWREALKRFGVPSKKISSVIRIIELTNYIFEQAKLNCGVEVDYKPTNEEDAVSIEYRRLLCMSCSRDLELILRYSEKGWAKRTPTTLDAIRGEIIERAMGFSDRKSKDNKGSKNGKR
jgi:hypothetical protein